MMKSFKRVMSCFLALAIMCSLFIINPGAAKAASQYGIHGNGTQGISIDINGSPYTDMANVPTWGQYAYGPSGCAWFATSRAKQLTGKNITTIYAGNTWYNTAYSYFGFARGTTLSTTEKALACYSGHVAVVEKVVGDTVYISEGGYNVASYAGHGYTRIAAVTKSYLMRSGFLGFVYLGVGQGAGSQPAPANVSFTDRNINFVQDTNAEIYIKVLNPNRLNVTKVGCYLYDANGNLINSYYENCNYTTSYVNYTCNFNSDMGYTLKRGTKYKCVLYTVVNGTEYKDSMIEFTTTGNSDDQKPVISDVSLIDFNDEGYTIKCKATDNVKVDRVQFPVWTAGNGQDDIFSSWDTNPAARGELGTDGYYYYRVKLDDHGDEEGIYHNHIYAYDTAGNSICYVADSVEVTKIVPTATPDPTPIPTEKPVADIITGPTSEPTARPTVRPTARPIINQEKLELNPSYNNGDSDDYIIIDDGEDDTEAEEYVKRPGKVGGLYLYRSGKKIVFGWRGKNNISGYEVRYAQNKKFTKNQGKKNLSAKKNSVKIKGVKKGKTYYLKIRAYVEVNGEKIYGDWSKVKKIKIR